MTDREHAELSRRLALAFGQVLPFGIDQAPDVAIISTSDKRCQLGFDDGIVSRIWGHALPDARKAIMDFLNPALAKTFRGIHCYKAPLLIDI